MWGRIDVGQLKIIIIVLVGCYILASLFLYLLQERFIFLGEPLRSDYQFDFEIPHTEVNIIMEDGAQINTIHFKSFSEFLPELDEKFSLRQ